MIKENFGRLPESIHLDWVQTEENSLGEIQLTGEVQSFEVKIKAKDVNAMKDRIWRASQSISENFERWKKQRKDLIDQRLLDRYWILNSNIEDLEEERSKLRKQIQENFESNAVDKFETKFGCFSFSTRKTFQFSDVVKAAEQKVKTLKAAEKNTADFKESRTFTFRFQKTNGKTKIYQHTFLVGSFYPGSHH